MWLDCPYLGGGVELTDERSAHIASRHPEVWPQYLDHLAKTVADPDEVRIDADYARTRLFLRWFGDLLGGKMVVVAIVSQPPPETRHWVVTALASSRAPLGDVEWKRH